MNDPFFARLIGSRLTSAARVASRGGSRPKVILLFGARQTGKSTLLAHCVERSPRTLVLDLQDPRLRRRHEEDGGLLVRELEASPGIETVLIDEVQKVPALLDAVQFLHDRDPRGRRFILTGSSSRRLKGRSANLMPGRVHSLILSPVIQAEQRTCAIMPIEMPGAGARFPVRKLEDHLLYGDLPGLYHEDRGSWIETLAAYVDLYIEIEIRKENLVQDTGAFLRFLKLAAMESGHRVNYTKLASAVGVAANTLRNFFQVLEDTYVGFRIPHFSRSRKRVITAPRFLIFDVGVRHVLADLPIGPAILKMDAGHVFEQWVLAELYNRCRYSGSDHRLSTWTTATGAEVDAVVETPDGVVPVEIKWTDSPTPRDARHVETFLDLHAKEAKAGYVVCRCPHRQSLTGRVTALPWDEF